MSLGFYNIVRTLLERRGLHGFIEVVAEVYPRLTFEFLATLTRYEFSKGYYIRFNALNIIYTMCYYDVVRAFDWIIRGDDYVLPNEENEENEEEEDYVPYKEQSYRDPSLVVDLGHNWYQQYDESLSNMENVFGEMEGWRDCLDDNLQTFQESYN